MKRSGEELRQRLERGHLMLLFTPALCRAGADPMQVLAAALPHLDMIQVRIKSRDVDLAPARELHDWSRRVLALVAEKKSDALVLVDDRIDVAGVLLGEGLAGVHVGTEDAPAGLARRELGPAALIGVSTHTASEVVAAQELPVDYLGFGPVHPTRTKGYARGLGSEAAWVASRASVRPVFPIGGIDATNVAELVDVGRAAVSSAILGAADPAAAARELATLLVDG